MLRTEVVVQGLNNPLESKGDQISGDLASCLNRDTTFVVS